METEFDRHWAEQAIERISTRPTLSDAITTTAGYITESIWEIWRMMGSEDHDGDFHRFIDWVIEGLGENPSPDFRPLWEAMKEILDMTGQVEGMEEWQVELEATQRLSAYIDPSKDRLDAVGMLLRQIISCLSGWLEGTLEAVNEYMAGMQGDTTPP